MSPRWNRAVAAGLCLLSPSAWGQQPLVSIEPVRPAAPLFLRPYQPATVPPVRLSNSARLASLVRGGNLYLTSRDAVALALENNIDIEVARYTPLLQEWRLERSEAGGTLPGVPSGSSQANTNTSGQGVLGSQQSAGVTGGNNGTIRTSNNATVTQIGPVTQTLDPTFQEASTFSHRSLPQANATQSITQVLVLNQRNQSAAYQQGFVSGGSVTIRYNQPYLNENSPSDVLNPSVLPSLSFSVTQNLLNGFGAKVGGRTIAISRMNLKASDQVFKTQVVRTVGTVLNTYFTLAADFEDRKAKQTAVEAAKQFLTETRRRLELGSIAALDVSTADNQLALARQDLVNADAALAREEVQMKNLISRTGLGEPLLAAVHIIPIEPLQISPSDDLPPVRELVERTLATRSDILSEQTGLQTSEVSALGTRNGLLPSLQVIANRSTSGLGGTPRIVRGGSADPRFVGGTGIALEQILAQNFPSESVSVGGRVVLNNRQAQADFAIDQLSLRQQQLSTARDLKQAQVDVMNAVIALRQARSRWEAAAQNRVLQQKLSEAEQKKFSAGESTTYNVTRQLRDLASATSSENDALVTWKNARVNIGQTTGTILEENGISISEARTGQVTPASTLPPGHR